MAKATTESGREIRYETEHRAGDGRLISRQITIPEPKMPDPPKPPDPNCRKCIYKYIKDFDKWTRTCQALMKEYGKVLDYHAKRVEFAEKYRNANIPEKYRTGEPSPETGIEAEKEMKILKKLEKEVKNEPGTGC